MLKQTRLVLRWDFLVAVYFSYICCENLGLLTAYDVSYFVVFCILLLWERLIFTFMV